MPNGPLDLTVEKNRLLLDECIANFDNRTGPRVGDYVRTLDGLLRRFTYDWGDSIQTTASHNRTDVSFHLSRRGYADFSGSLDPGLDKKNIELTSETMEARFWMFDRGIPGGGMGRYFDIKVRVFKEVINA